MRALMALVVVGTMGSACTTMDNLNSVERGDFLALENVSFERVWPAANTGMARNFRVVETDSEIGEIRGISGTRDHVWDVMFWRQSIALFVWPTQSNDFGYTINIDAMPGPPLSLVESLSVSVDTEYHPSKNGPSERGPHDWRKILLRELKKELGAS